MYYDLGGIKIKSLIELYKCGLYKCFYCKINSIEVKMLYMYSIVIFKISC
jgi:hypothetical protein